MQLSPIFCLLHPVSDERRKSGMSKPTPMIPNISSIYGFNLWRRIFDKMLYEVNSSDIP
jgi:hypothetical protein